MDAAAVEATIRRRTAAADWPALTGDDVAACVDAARVGDSAGLAPTDPDWTPVWCVAAGIALGWELKALKVAGAYEFTAGGDTFKRDALFGRFMALAKRYRAITARDARITSDAGRIAAANDTAYDPSVSAGGWES